MENIIQLFRNGLSIRKISKLTGVHRQKVSDILKMGGCEVRKGADKKRVLELFNSGSSLEEIAKQTRVGETTVTRILNQHGFLFYKKRIFTNKEESEILTMYNEGVSIESIAEVFSCGVKNIQDSLRSRVKGSLASLSHRKARTLPIRDCEIIEMYRNEKTMEEIGIYCGTTTASIKKILVENKEPLRFKNKKYTVDDEYFDKIDSHEKAYFLGFFYGDGYHNFKKREMIISIQSKDRIVLDFFTKELKSTRPIRKVEPQQEGWQEKATFSFCSKQISEKFLSFGCGSNKTYNLKFPDYIPKKFLNSFVLGLFDADGSIYIDKKGAFHFSICGTKDICDGVFKFFEEFGVKIHVYPHKSGIFYAKTSKKDSVKLIAKIMYENSKIWLPRKKIVFDVLKPC